jgi:hypothetical protein
MRSRTTALVIAAALASPAAALADVDIGVPRAFLGGPIAAAIPVARAAGPAGQGVDPAAGRPARAPVSGGDPCAGQPAGDCLVVGADALVDQPPFPVVFGDDAGPGPEAPPDDPDTPDDPAAAPAPPPDDGGQVQSATARPVPAAPVVPPGAADQAQAFGGLLSPAAAAWLPWETPVLRWRPRSGARYYNVQVFRGARRVLSAWPRAPRLRVPADVLKQGRTYVWVVWPGRGVRARAVYGSPVGRATFEVTLRPRIVFHGLGAGRGVVGEVRPHIPHATLGLRAPGRLARRVPARVSLDARGRLRLPLARSQAERLSARLIDRGPRPPLGLRGGEVRSR